MRRQPSPPGTTVDRFLPLPGAERPELFLPLDRRDPARYALTELAWPRARWKRTRNRLLATLIARRIVPPLPWPLVLLSQQGRRPPFFVAAAQRLGVPPDADWLLEPGSGDELSRGVFHLFHSGSARPSWILKYARVPDYAEPFDRDERGLAIAAQAEIAAAHAPALLGRIEVDGLNASVETAAVGRRLIAILTTGGSRRTGERIIDRIASWIVAVGREATGPPGSFEHEPDAGLNEQEQLAVLSPVLAHNDLGSWNLVVDGEGFVAIDWESAEARGFPLWDLWYFLADALAQLDGAATLPQKEQHFVQLFAGELASSQLLFRWTRTAQEACSVPAELVGLLATLCWRHHGRSHVARTAAMRRYLEVGEAPVHLVERAPSLWLSHPALGSDWNVWR